MANKKQIIAESIRNRIIAGSLKEYAPIRITDCATQHRVNRKTAGDAIHILVDEGLLVNRRGIGWVVADGAQGVATAAAMETIAAEIPDLVAKAGTLGLDRAKFLTMVENAWRNK